MDMNNWLDPITGRWYRVVEDGESRMIIGPPEELVEKLGLAEPTATNLHNALFRRGILTYADASKRNHELVGAWQEALNLDAQRLHETFYLLQKEEVPT